MARPDRYNTGHPVGSTDPRDLYDNAGNLDNFVNGEQPFYPDRLNKQRRSWRGMEYDFNNAIDGWEIQFQQFLKNSGYEFLGDYGAGLTFERRSQYVIRDGNAYRLANSVTLPYTTTGNWDSEQDNFVLLNQDNILRQDLSSSEPDKGAALVRGAIRTFTSIMLASGANGELRTTAGRYDGEQVFVQGYYDDSRQRGGGEYYWDASSTLDDDLGTVIQVDGEATGRWMMVPRPTTFADFGARGDGVTDDWEAINSAVTSRFSKRFPVGLLDEVYGVSQTVQIGSGVSLQGASAFNSIIKALPGFSGESVVLYLEPNGTLNSINPKNFRVSVNGNESVHGIDIRRAYDCVLIENLVCIDAADNANAIRIVGHVDSAPVTINQTIVAIGLFAGHANQSATAATIFIDRLQEAVFTECKAWGCYGANKAPASPWVFQDCRSIVLTQISCATSSGYAIRVLSNGRSGNGLNFISPLYERVDNIMEVVGTSSLPITNLSHVSPRYENPISGGFDITWTNSVRIDTAGRPINIDADSVAAMIETSDATNITNLSRNTSVIRRANAVSEYVHIGPLFQAGPLTGNPHIRTRAPAIGETSITITHNDGTTSALKNVLAGAVDSGGSGYRVLRIPN